MCSRTAHYLAFLLLGVLLVYMFYLKYDMKKIFELEKNGIPCSLLASG